MQSPWFILELQCYDPLARTLAPLDRMDKIDFLSLSFSEQPLHASPKSPM